MLRKKQRGAAIVEAALVMLVTFTMSLFIIDMGRLMLIQEFIADRARVTVRQAAVNNWTATQVQNYFVYDSPSTQSSTAPGRLGLLPSQVSYATLGTAGAHDYRLQVRVARVPAFLFVPYLHGRYFLPTVIATAPAESLGAAE